MIDLQSHTTASDGTWTPSELVAAAGKHEVSVLAVTDHDTVAGVEEAYGAGVREGVDVVAGIELSATDEGLKVHVLGLFVDHLDETLRSALQRFRNERFERARRIVAALNRLGYEITMDDVRAQAGNAAVGRPHVARALAARGSVRSVQEAFSARLLGDGGPGDVHRPPLSPASAIAIIRDARGVPVVAHPGAPLRALSGAGLPDALIERMAAGGLAGVEVEHPDHSSRERERLRRLAQRTGLIPTGGSDCHGPGTARPQPGVCTTSRAAFERLLAARTW